MGRVGLVVLEGFVDQVGLEDQEDLPVNHAEEVNLEGL